jgi:hypothetical protein
MTHDSYLVARLDATAGRYIILGVSALVLSL